MASRKTWPIVITLFLMLGLFLVACERPLPDDGTNDIPPSESASEAYPETDADAGQPVPDSEPADSAYPADSEAELVQPVEEGDEAAESYPTDEEESSEGATAEGDSTEGDAAEEDTAESDTAEGDAAEGDAAEGDTAESDTAESEAAEGDATEGDTAEGDAAEEEAGEQTHIVAAGDTLYKIGAQYGVSWVEIATANGITNPDSLYIGQELIIPDLSVAEDAELTESEDSEAAESTETEETEESAEIIHVVQSGENLYRISIKYGVNMMDVARANDLSNFDSLAVGQELIIPAVDAAETEAETEEGPVEETDAEEITYEVKEGETVFGIAFQYGISWTDLVEQNDISSPYTLEAGQILIIPSGG